MYLVCDLVENRCHVAHMIYGENGVQHLALFTVLFIWEQWFIVVLDRWYATYGVWIPNQVRT